MQSNWVTVSARSLCTVGFAVGRGEELRAAIRKVGNPSLREREKYSYTGCVLQAKNKAVNYLQFIPRCDNHTSEWVHHL